MIKEAVIICGGTGTRLVSSGITTPKSLLQIDEENLIHTQIKFLVRNGIQRVHLALGHDSDLILQYLENSNLSAIIEIVPHVERKKIGTGGALLSIKEFISEDVFVIYGDILVDIYMKRILKGNVESSVSVISRNTEHPYDSDLLEVDFEDKILKFHAKPHADLQGMGNLAATGMFIFSTSAFDSLYARFHSDSFDLEREGIKYLIEGGHIVKHIPSYGLVQDVGTVDRLNRASGLWRKRINPDFAKPAIFLDRDGTVNVEQGYISKLENFRVFEDVPTSVRRMRDLGYFVFLVTNQPVIARGELSWRGLSQIHQELCKILFESETTLDGIFVCPHHPDSGFKGEKPELKLECKCRKPRNKMIMHSTEIFPIDISKSWVVGNSWRDRELAKSLDIAFAGVRDYTVPLDDCQYFLDLNVFVDFLEASHTS
jgi:D-glycero-D-manno-heptose 1,7-bisphosphate phosphatase